MKALRPEKRENGFTLLETMVAMAIIGVLSGIVVPHALSSRMDACDTAARNDLREAMTFLNLYSIDHGNYPQSAEALLAAGFKLSEDVSFTRYSVGRSADGELTVHMHVKHSKSTHAWHADYPSEGVEIEIR